MMRDVSVGGRKTVAAGVGSPRTIGAADAWGLHPQVPGATAMSEPFSAKLSFVLKAFSMSRGRLAADMGIDKSVVGRWVTGAVVPTEHNLMLLTAQFAQRAPKFTSLSWDRT